MVTNSLKNKTIKGVFWSGFEQFSVQGIHFLVLLVIARLLTPDDFGLVGMLAIFIAVAQSFIDSGFSQALIRKQDRTEKDTSTVFFFNLIASVIIYILLFLLAPFVSSFYNEPQLTLLMRVLCIVVVVNAFSVVQRAIYTSSLDFKTPARCSFISAIISGAIGVMMAIRGAGVWTLVWQQLINAGSCSIMLWLFSKWHPQWCFSWVSFKKLFSFGSNLLLSGLIDTIYNNAYTLVIGKFFSASSLGNYTQADKFSRLPSANLTTVLVKVTYPVFCQKQDDNYTLTVLYRKFIRLSAFLIFPIMCIMAGVSSSLIYVLLGEKWLEAATLIKPLCFALMWYPIHAINLNILKVKGRSDIFLKLEIIKKIIGTTILIICIPMGITAMCYGLIITSLVSLGINTFYTNRFISVGLVQQLSDISRTLIVSLITFIITLVITHFIKYNIWGLLIGIISGSVFYMLVSLIGNVKEITYVKEIVKQ